MNLNLFSEMHWLLTVTVALFLLTNCVTTKSLQIQENYETSKEVVKVQQLTRKSTQPLSGRIRRGLEEENDSREEENSQEEEGDDSATPMGDKQGDEEGEDTDDNEDSDTDQLDTNVRTSSSLNADSGSNAGGVTGDEDDQSKPGMLNEIPTEDKAGESKKSTESSLGASSNRTAKGQNPNPSLLQTRQVSTKPSMQLIGIVVGVVLTSVLLTGFIRWRVKKHLDAKRLKKFEEVGKKLTFKNRVRMQEGLMDTIHECEEVNGTPPPQTMANNANLNGRQGRSCGSWLRLVFCGETSTKDVHVNETKRVRANARLRMHRGYEDWDISVPPPVPKHDKISPWRSRLDHSRESRDLSAVTDPLLHQTHTIDMPNAAPSLTLVPPPVNSTRMSPSPGRGVMSSIRNTVFAFQRDWVGRRWLERHNLSISGILHGNSNQRNRANEGSLRQSEEDMSLSSDSSSVISDDQEPTARGRTLVHLSTTSLNSHQTADSVARRGFRRRACTSLDENANVTSCLSETILHRDSSNGSHTQCPSYVMNRAYMIQNVSPPRYSRSSCRPGTPVASRNVNRNQQERYSPDFNIGESGGGRLRSFSLPVNSLFFDQGRITSIEITPASPANSQDDLQMSGSPYPRASALSNDYSHQSGVVLEHLSDGSRIIFVPPPVLPLYHNDNPPPYR